uniref:Uncharacterized protein n=1 Tax=Arundo donax TaxID=35708 RepID=A0A0A8YJN2_ARUDO
MSSSCHGPDHSLLTDGTFQPTDGWSCAFKNTSVTMPPDTPHH